MAERAKVNWELVLKTDATPYQGDWDKLMLLVGRALPLVEETLSSDHSHVAQGLPRLGLSYPAEGAPARAGGMLERAVKDCQNHVGDAPQFDDTTIVSLGLMAEDEPGQKRQKQSTMEADDETGLEAMFRLRRLK